MILIMSMFPYNFSYLRRKQALSGGNPDHRAIEDVPAIYAERKRKLWRENKRKQRERQKQAKAVLDLTPDSFEAAPENVPEPIPLQVVEQRPPSPLQVNVPLASSTPERLPMRFKKLKKERRELNKQLEALKKQLVPKRCKSLNKLLRKSREKRNAKDKLVARSEMMLKAAQRRKSVMAFLCRDENSHLLPGKKDTITKNKVKTQRCVLTKTMKELHALYISEVDKELSLSYRQFLRLRPFYVTEPKTSDRNTCACIDHENVSLLLDKFYQNGLLKTKSTSEMISAIVCNVQKKQCMYRVCSICCYREIEVALPDAREINWQQWERQKTVEGDHTFTHFIKKTCTGTWAELLLLLNRKLDDLAKHQYIWLHQVALCRTVKETLHEKEAVVHMDFSENYGCKLSTEVQSFHFGGSRQQATIHITVVYTNEQTQSYATISNSLRHDERAVWAHLKPVLEDLKKQNPMVSVLHFMSDGPLTQYRNKKNFYLISTITFRLGFQEVTWNFSEKNHGKGAPDGVGGAVKRCADDMVRKGRDIQCPLDLYKILTEKESAIKFFWVAEGDVAKFDEAVLEKLAPVKGTLKLHQICSKVPGKICYRDVSCFCSRTTTTCSCDLPTEVDFNKDMEVRKQGETISASVSTSVSASVPTSVSASTLTTVEDLNGKFVIVSYDGQPFIGQVLLSIGDEVQVSCMQQNGSRNSFVWPSPPDEIYNSNLMSK